MCQCPIKYANRHEVENATKPSEPVALALAGGGAAPPRGPGGGAGDGRRSCPEPFDWAAPGPVAIPGAGAAGLPAQKDEFKACRFPKMRAAKLAVIDAALQLAKPQTPPPTPPQALPAAPVS